MTFFVQLSIMLTSSFWLHAEGNIDQREGPSEIEVQFVSENHYPLFLSPDLYDQIEDLYKKQGAEFAPYDGLYIDKVTIKNSGKIILTLTHYSANHSVSTDSKTKIATAYSVEFSNLKLYNTTVSSQPALKISNEELDQMRNQMKIIYFPQESTAVGTFDTKTELAQRFLTDLIENLRSNPPTLIKTDSIGLVHYVIYSIQKNYDESVTVVASALVKEKNNDTQLKPVILSTTLESQEEYNQIKAYTDPLLNSDSFQKSHYIRVYKEGHTEYRLVKTTQKPASICSSLLMH